MEPVAVAAQLVVVSAAGGVVALVKVNLALAIKLAGGHAGVEEGLLAVDLLLDH